MDGETLEALTGFIFLGSKTSTDSDCMYEIKRQLPLGRRAIINLDCILQSRDIALPTKICLVKAMDFPIVTCGCESWTIKQAEHQKIDAFVLFCFELMLLNCGVGIDS